MMTAMSTVNADRVGISKMAQMVGRLETSNRERVDALLARRQELQNQIQQLKARLAQFEGGAL
jgi:anti-sigma-K factor RskA